MRVRKKGILILPKKLREEIGIKEGDSVLVEVKDDTLIIKPLRPKIVDIDPELVEEILSEESNVEKKKYNSILKKD